MALFRLPLSLDKKINFWKLMGCGRNGGFDRIPDWWQWALLEVRDEAFIPGSLSPTPDFLRSWWKFFRCEIWTLELEPLEGRGKWDGKEVFGPLATQSGYEGLIGVLTRATIRPVALRRFWKQVDGVADRMKESPGFIVSIGIGEIPWIKQATFSLWDSKALMKQFAYQMQEHTTVIRKTREEDWYSEEMFVRFRPLASHGSIRGKNPLERKL
ncbi:MAG: hypothetical protein NVSMB63_05000 [Sediminibacterium sp.]